MYRRTLISNSLGSKLLFGLFSEGGIQEWRNKKKIPIGKQNL